MNAFQVSHTASKKVAQVVRCARKGQGLTQSSLAKLWGVSQSFVSRIEDGSRIPNILEWQAFCDLTRIPIESGSRGYIDELSPSVSLMLKEDASDCEFRLPKRYAGFRGTTVRALQPFVQLYGASFGQAALNDFFVTHKMDPDFMVNYNHQSNLNLLHDLAERLILKGVVTESTVDRLAGHMGKREGHGALHAIYDQARDRIQLIRQVVENAFRYDCNFSYRVEALSDQSVDVSVRANPHVKTFRRDEILGAFLCRYKRSFFEQFSGYQGEAKARVTERECMYQGASRCLYHIVA